MKGYMENSCWNSDDDRLKNQIELCTFHTVTAVSCSFRLLAQPSLIFAPLLPQSAVNVIQPVGVELVLSTSSDE